MSSFRDYLASGSVQVNESVDLHEANLHEADHEKLISSFKELTKEVNSKLKLCTLDMAGSSPYIGVHDKTLKLYVTLDNFGSVRVSQSSKSDHTVSSLRHMSEVANELAQNMPYIEKTLKLVKKLFDAYA